MRGGKAAARFPADPWATVEAAAISNARGDFEQALRLAAELRGRFPDNPTGYRIGAAAARRMKRFGEASAIIKEAAARFPAEEWPMAEAARR